METGLIKAEVELIKIRYLSRLRYLEFQIYLEKIKFKRAIHEIEMKNKSFIPSDYKTKKIYFYSPKFCTQHV